ncbi:DUF4743 domain-containing protein [Dongia soli]|uniref:DUF4743 domain-containing protein n=1 Tax=Dongia soli TaxID=600628 RepID=A0ABU5E5A4_9PROT|nr:DUF4743 domain-containing protein [Dongia soli]MDY0881224.1 DUF4743 domain-containing protein [Dongia soli]
MRQFRRYPPVDFARYLKFIVADQHVGWVRRTRMDHLAAFPKVFAIGNDRVAMQDGLADFESRSAAMAEVLAAWREAGLVTGWRNELFPVNRGFGQPPLLCMERAGTPLFGILSYGVNINGLVGQGRDLHLWIGRRAAHKPVDPNMLDLVVGGGQPMGITVWDNLVKECWEEAGIEAEIARQAKPVSLTTLTIEAGEGLRVGLQFNYDLHLPADFMPNNMDGEVVAFQLMPVQSLIENLLNTDEFSYDIALVKIDLLIRHGYLGPDDPDYLDLVAGLRRPIAFDPL